MKLFGNINEPVTNIMPRCNGDLDEIEEVTDQNERINGRVVGHLRCVQNIRSNELQSIVCILEGFGWFNFDR